MATRLPSHPSSDESLSVRVARRIAAHEGVDPTELSPPLYHSLDPDALDTLFEPISSGGPRAGCVTFSYDGKRVTVDSDGEIAIESEQHAQSR
ncbi:hypothetical protein CV102_07700 [Natronococcus pandeyae]|uniref:Halobacterial output domain-containing protein n=1 Tax=Natronococcus pandeyae TaxID=2055836 RepID=A0A8J8Q5Y4_9EURY|nr:HalOD1 output domain-containing protein [Natronococcus pandeyae]TYL39163.1 hypothetical protein CV102_07700 [Natronococcus pandeyae]